MVMDPLIYRLIKRYFSETSDANTSIDRIVRDMLSYLPLYPCFLASPSSTTAVLAKLTADDTKLISPFM